ncbi:hypothetical protein EYZ11_013055 [Aspergillus tanneri]|uniref:Uncharacterized protein n=1 Tax=Aspergillus tanneri TaxID=1220188 RepID=A0A4S3IYL8_9EURO|nr:hypothetical protein EYZ11_013055 [Aspergillus tanneri]
MSMEDDTTAREMQLIKGAGSPPNVVSGLHPDWLSSPERTHSSMPLSSSFLQLLYQAISEPLKYSRADPSIVVP